MKKNLATKCLNPFPIVVVAVLLLVRAKPAQAMPCFTDLDNCYVDAAVIDNAWYRWARALNCEIDFVSCLREDVVGR